MSMATFSYHGFSIIISPMFDLEFVESVKRALDWRDSPQLEVLTQHESIVHMKRIAREEKRGNDELQGRLHDYVVDSYPAYFGLKTRVRGKFTHWNHVLCEPY